MISDKLYDFLKQLDLVWLPAIGTAYAGLAQIWSLPYADEIPATIMVICTMLGAFLNLSSSTYYRNLGEGIYFDGEDDDE